MRILHVLSERGFSGGEVQLQYILEHLHRQGHDNRLLLQPGARFASTAARLGIPVTRARMRNGGDLLAMLRIRACVKRVQPDLVQFACSRSHKLGGNAMRGIGGPARVVTRRMDYPLRPGRYGRWLYGGAVDAVVAISRGVQTEIERIGVPASRIELIYEGVDPERYAGLTGRRMSARRELGIPDEAVAAVCAASLTRRKGQVHLLRAFGVLAARSPQVHLVLAGEGPERVSLEAIRDRLGLAQRVSIPGQISTEVALAAADFGCMPSLREGLSVFCLEAQSSGLPVVASRVGGLPESVADGVTGILVPPGDEAALEAALVRLFEDVGERRRMGVAAQAHVRETFAAEDMAKKTEAFYRKLVERRRASSG